MEMYVFEDFVLCSFVGYLLPLLGKIYGPAITILCDVANAILQLAILRRLRPFVLWYHERKR
jgi:hypothetical protein